MSFAQTPSPSPTPSGYQSPGAALPEQANATLGEQLQMNIPEVVQKLLLLSSATVGGSITFHQIVAEIPITS